jgi:acyl dehydratase
MSETLMRVPYSATLGQVTSDWNGLGTEFRPIGKSIVFSQSRICNFADYANDHQWIHVHPERAFQESPLRRTIVHGAAVLVEMFSRMIEVAGLVEVEGLKSVLHSGGSYRFGPPVTVDQPIQAYWRPSDDEHKKPLIAPKRITLWVDYRFCAVGKEYKVALWGDVCAIFTRR